MMPVLLGIWYAVEMRLHGKVTSAILLLALALPLWAADFSTEVEPILREHCYDCHGPTKRKGGLRLSGRDAAMLGGDSGHPAVAPSDPDGSAMLQRISTSDPALRMPPTGGPLDPAKVEVLRAWIAEGAHFAAAGSDEAEHEDEPAHWAYRQPQEAPLPVAKQDPWVRNSIDAFVLDKMGQADLAPSPEADRYTLIRRLSLDLIGLPPAPAEIEAFVNDTAPDAYERLVERLLASPHYGEKQALHWLDAARYADTNGYEKDRHRSIWPYRDWVIDAFNKDMPFDQFLVEQLAGDMLPGATTEQRIATGFLRNSMWNEEGGVDVEEFRYEAMVDRVNTVSTVALGLTLACAQCHTHKVDDITQREYFQFYAFLNNTDDVEVRVEQEEVARRRDQLERHIARAIRSLASDFPATETLTSGQHLAERYAAWEAEARATAHEWKPLDPVSMTSKNRATMQELEDHSVLVTGDFPNTDEYTLDLRSNLQRITAIRIEALPDHRLPGGGPGRGVIMSKDGDFLLSEVALTASPWGAPESATAVPLQNATQSYAGEGRSAAQALDGKLDTGWGIKGREGEAHWAVFELATPVDNAGEQLLRLKLDQYYVHQHTLGRLRISATGDALPVAAAPVPADLETALLLDPDARTESQTAALKQHFLLTCDELKDDQEKIAALRAQMPQHPTSLVLVERAQPRVATTFHRGEFLKPRDPVSPGVPALLHDLPEHAPRTRLTFAQWLASEENPLFARVTVNRLWQQFFGKGIVASVDDFGLKGDAPTHPELLDALALEFVRRGWSTKEMVRLIVTSATYRQSSTVTPEHLERDPQNDLLARAPRFRVDAQTVRDIALAASGLLSGKLGGPSVYPPMPPGILDLAYGGGGAWPESTGEDRFRRGLYTYWKRTMPYPTLATFDAPAADRACVRRTRSNTPLQALTLLNDVAYTEAAQAMAQRVLNEAPEDLEARVAYASLLALGRKPAPEETQMITAFIEDQHARIESGALDPTTLATLPGGLAAASETQTPEQAQTAVWTLACRVLLNLDETITRR